MPPRLGLNLPLSFGTGASRGEMAAWLARAEAAPLDAVWTLDQLSGRVDAADPLALLGFAAAHAARLRLGIAVLVAPPRGPVAVAKALATLDCLSGGGRLIAGVGSGDRALFPALGAGPGALMDEFVTVLPRLWREDDVTHPGPAWPLSGVTVRPRPLVAPELWIGGGSAGALRRAVRCGQGWIGAGRHDPAEFAALAARLRELAHAQGRDLSGLAVAKRAYLVIESSRSRAEQVIDAWFAGFYGNAELGRRVTIAGPAASCAEQLAFLAEAGATDLILHPLVSTPAHDDALYAELLPALSALP